MLIPINQLYMYIHEGCSLEGCNIQAHNYCVHSQALSVVMITVSTFLGSLYSRLSVLTRLGTGTQSSNPQSQSNPLPNTPSTSSSEHTSSSSSRKRKHVAPSFFTKKRQKFPGGRSTKTIRYVRDIVCLPKEWSKNLRHVTIPRKERRRLLAESGLVGKIEFDSDMCADDVVKEVCKVFAYPMGLTPEGIEQGDRFNFIYLQRAGAGCRSLCSPSVADTFDWNGRRVATLAKSGGIIYVLAMEPVLLLDDSEVS